jgi:hypothetical protein
MRVLILLSRHIDVKSCKYYLFSKEKNGFRQDENKITIEDDVYVCSNKVDGVKVYYLSEKDKYNTDKRRISIYRNQFDQSFELIYVENVLTAAIISDNRIDLFKMSLADPIKYALATYIGQDLMPLNKIETLVDIKRQLDSDIDNEVSKPEDSLFLSTKINGETCLVFISIDKTYIFSMKMKKIDSIIREMDITMPDGRVMIFLAELVKSTKTGLDDIYLFLECRNNGDFKIDMKHMKTACEHVKEFKMNTFIIGEKRQDAFKKILDIKPDYPTDGVVFGNIWTKEHYKWKPVEFMTVDFLVLHDDYYTINVTEREVIKVWAKVSGDEWSQYIGKVVECNYLNGKWHPIRERKDRNGIPNSFKTANSNWAIIKHPITKKELLSY